MSNEWVKVELYGSNNDGNPRRFTIADGASISKGEVLALTDPRTATAMAVQSYCAGVASEEHVADQDVTDIAAWTDGVFDAVASGAIPVGAAVIGCPGNTIMDASAALIASAAIIIGQVYEAAADGERVNVRLRL